MTTAQVGYASVHRWVKQVLGQTHMTVIVTVAWAVLCLLVAQRVTGTAYAEAALLRQWVLAGMQQFRVVEAIRLYQDGHIDIHQAAARARLPVAILLDEMAARKVAILDQPDAFGPGLEALRGTFGAGPEEETRKTAVASHP